MKKQIMTLAGIPAILYGSRSRNVYLYLHGKNGCKEEAERFAATACEAGWQVLAIDLPEHGARKNSPERLLPWVAVPEIEAVYARMKPVWAHIRLYGVSIGAWLAMQALQGDAPEQTLLVSPVVDMEALITNMMQYAHVTEEQLHRAGEIPTDLGETLSWPYLCWVREHPLHWHGRTQVLYGDRDALTSRTMIERFRQESGAHLGGRGTLVPHPSADGGPSNVGRSKPLILVLCNWAEGLEWPPLRSGHFQRKYYFYICKPAKPAGFAGLLFHGKGRDRTLHFLW